MMKAAGVVQELPAAKKFREIDYDTSDYVMPDGSRWYAAKGSAHPGFVELRPTDYDAATQQLLVSRIWFENHCKQVKLR